MEGSKKCVVIPGADSRKAGPPQTESSEEPAPTPGAESRKSGLPPKQRSIVGLADLEPGSPASQGVGGDYGYAGPPADAPDSAGVTSEDVEAVLGCRSCLLDILTLQDTL